MVAEHCTVMVRIHPVDPAAPDIIAQVNLPTAWNGKAVMFGGGGYDGVFSNNAAGGAGNYFNGPIDRPTALAQGYATFASDSGHEANGLGSQDGSFALNQEALMNFSGYALKKARDVAVHLVEARYGTAPARSYFVGGSSGGREALWVVQNTPDDFDGAVAMYPAWNAATLDLFFGRTVRALARPDGYPNDAKKLVWMHAILDKCDKLDGVVDGLVSHVKACNFDPRTVRCPGGGDTGDTCLSDAQIGALELYGSDMKIPYPIGSGETYYPGFNVLRGADLTGPLDMNLTQPTHELMTSDQAAAAACTPATQSCPYKAMPYFAVFWDQWVKYFVTGDPTFDSLNLDPQQPGPYQQRITDLTALQDVSGSDLSAFQRRGGKLILMHGLADGLVSTDATTQYYQRLKAAMGNPTVRSFVRYYTIPGLGHVFGAPFTGDPNNTGFTAAWDPLSAVAAWVEDGTAPGTLVATDARGPHRGRTRPVCEYPGWPRYVGGDVNSAASFRCTAARGDGEDD
jgi:feruloyl esterase